MKKAQLLDLALPTTFRGEFWVTRDYPGYTLRESWNGWACPFFEKAAADQLLADLAADVEQSDDPTTLSYLNEVGRDTYIIQQQSTDDGGFEVVEAIEGIDLPTAEGVRHVYPIGAHIWTWQERGVHFE